MNKLEEDVYAAEFTIKKWVDKVTGKTRTRRIRPNRITFANNLLQGIKKPIELGDEGSMYMYKPPTVQKSPTAKAVLSKERAAARRAQRQEKTKKHMDESLNPSMGAGEYVKDFKKSTAPQFKGKSAKKRAQMAVAAYMSDKTKSQNEERENGMEELRELAEHASELSVVADQAYFLCLDEEDNLYISEDFNDEVIATYVEGQMIIADDIQLDEEVIDALDVEFIQE